MGNKAKRSFKALGNVVDVPFRVLGNVVDVPSLKFAAGSADARAILSYSRNEWNSTQYEEGGFYAVVRQGPNRRELTRLRAVASRFGRKGLVVTYHKTDALDYSANRLSDGGELSRGDVFCGLKFYGQGVAEAAFGIVTRGNPQASLTDILYSAILVGVFGGAGQSHVPVAVTHIDELSKRYALAVQYWRRFIDFSSLVLNGLVIPVIAMRPRCATDIADTLAETIATDYYTANDVEKRRIHLSVLASMAVNKSTARMSANSETTASRLPGWVLSDCYMHGLKTFLANKRTYSRKLIGFDRDVVSFVNGLVAGVFDKIGGRDYDLLIPYTDGIALAIAERGGANDNS